MSSLYRLYGSNHFLQRTIESHDFVDDAYLIGSHELPTHFRVLIVYNDNRTGDDGFDLVEHSILVQETFCVLVLVHPVVVERMQFNLPFYPSAVVLLRGSYVDLAADVIMMPLMISCISIVRGISALDSRDVKYS